MTRRSVFAKAVEAQERAPVTAWVIWVGAMTALGFRLYAHGGHVTEDWKHVGADGALALIAIVAAPGFMRYAGKNAAILIELYRKFRAAKKEPQEGDR